MSKLIVIALEGMNGCGKTTTLKHVEQSLLEDGIDAEVIKSPGGTKVGMKIREMLLDHDTDLSVLAEFMMFAADNAQTWIERVESRFGYREKPIVLLLDRCLLSSLAFQGVRGLPEEKIVAAMVAPCEHVFLQKIFVLNVPWRVAAQRLDLRSGKLDRIESLPIDIQKLTAQTYSDVSIRGTFAGTPVIGLNGEDPALHNAQIILNHIYTELRK